MRARRTACSRTPDDVSLSADSATSGRRACRPSSAQSAAARVAGRSALATSRSRGTTADRSCRRKRSRAAVSRHQAAGRRSASTNSPVPAAPRRGFRYGGAPSAVTRQIRPRSRPLLRSRWRLSDDGMDHGCSMVSRYMSQI